MEKKITKTYEQVVSEVFLKHKERLIDISRKEKDKDIDQPSNHNDKLNLLLQIEEELKTLWQ